MQQPQLAQRALQAYETLRQAVMEQLPRPAGMAALRYHGMWHGLVILMQAPVPVLRTPSEPVAGADRIACDPQFVRLMANLVLRTHSEIVHVY